MNPTAEIPIYRSDKQSQRLLLEEKLSAKLTDVVCRKRCRFYENSGEHGTFSPHPPPSGHLLLKEKALGQSTFKLPDKSEFRLSPLVRLTQNNVSRVRFIGQSK